MDLSMAVNFLNEIDNDDETVQVNSRELRDRFNVLELPTNQKPEIVQNTTLTESHRYSLDITEDLKNIIEQKKTQKTVQFRSKEEIVNIPSDPIEMEEQMDILKQDIESENMNRSDDSECDEISMCQENSNENREKFKKTCEKTVSGPNQKLNNMLVWQKTLDESFEALERMCDKTASDPNSTLFKYLHTECSEVILAEVKKRNTDRQITEDQLLDRINNCTLLEDIEAPSRMWETTLSGDNILQTSPVKMVGLLRPSTIIEEAPDESSISDLSSHQSFYSAAKSAHSDASSVYESAYSSNVGTKKTDFSNNFSRADARDQDLLIHFDQYDNENGSSFDLLENTIVDPITCTKKSNAIKNFNGNNISDDLIDLEETFGPTHCLNRNNDKEKNIESSEDELDFESNINSCNLLDGSVIEIGSDDEDNDNVELTPNNESYNSGIKCEVTDVNSDTYSFNETKEDNKENSVDNHAQSMQFNDTMEEVEYLLKKGMEYMVTKAGTEKSSEQIKFSVPTSNIKDIKVQMTSPIKHLKTTMPTEYKSPSKAKSCLYTTPAKKTPQTKGPSSTSKRFDFDIRPFPKLEIFAKPLDRTRTRELAIKQQKFSHIVSPIGTYMKKTAQTPLMSSINSRDKDYFNSTAIMELENESRLYKPQFKTNLYGHETERLAKLPGLLSDEKRALPKKAYISSDLKHIVDERTPITIPASKQIQKYLENAMMPAVLRHEGKIKVPGSSSKLPLKVSDTNSTNLKTKTSHIPRRNNASLADLSVMSGDVSMYTIMDAQKF